MRLRRKLGGYKAGYIATDIIQIAAGRPFSYPAGHWPACSLRMKPDSSKIRTGTILAQKYRLDSRIGTGGMASVWRAEHLALGAPVAVKLLDPHIADTEEALQRFRREAHAAASIRSPNVVQVLDHGVDEASRQPFIVLELLEGQTLGDRLVDRGCLSLAATISVLVDAARALARAHEAGIVHRDLKPDNIFLVSDSPEYAKLLDFGIAKGEALAMQQGGSTQHGAVFGTPSYMSPEQISGNRDIDPRIDLWALAAVAFECVTGRVPFDADTIGGLAVKITSAPIPRASTKEHPLPAFDAWLDKGLCRDINKRFQTARTLSDALKEAGELEGDAAHIVRSRPALAGAQASPDAEHATPKHEATQLGGIGKGGEPDADASGNTSKSGRRRWRLLAALVLFPLCAWGAVRLMKPSAPAPRVTLPSRAAGAPNPRAASNPAAAARKAVPAAARNSGKRTNQEKTPSTVTTTRGLTGWTKPEPGPEATSKEESPESSLARAAKEATAKKATAKTKPVRKKAPRPRKTRRRRKTRSAKRASRAQAKPETENSVDGTKLPALHEVLDHRK